MSGWFGRGATEPAALSPDEVARRNAAMLERLQQQRDSKAGMIGELEKNVKRFHASMDASSKVGDIGRAAQFKSHRDSAYNSMKQLEREQVLLGGQIATLMGVTNNVQAMHNNVELHQRIKESNSATALIAKHMDPDDVHDTMADVGEHRDQLDEVSRALSGETIAPVQDADEQAAEIAAFCGLNTSNAANAHEAEERLALQRKEAEMERLLAQMPLPAQRRTQVPVRAGPNGK